MMAHDTKRPLLPLTSIPQMQNLSLAGMHVLLNVVQLFILPLYLLPKNMRWGVLIVPIAALNNPFWALIHEAIHDLFSSSPNMNFAAGRLLSILFGSPFHILRLTHLSHHKFNRSPLEKGTEVYDPTKISRLKASVGYYFYLFCGLYLLEVCSVFLFFLPSIVFHRLRRRLANQRNDQAKWLAKKFMQEKLVRGVRIDGVTSLLIFVLSAFCYGVHWRLFVSVFASRMFLVSFMDNVYHYGSPLNITVSGHNLWLPRVVSTMILNFNLHRVHHRNPAVPWVKLPELFVQHSETFDSDLFAAAMKQLRGPLQMSELAGHANVKGCAKNVSIAIQSNSP